MTRDEELFYRICSNARYFQHRVSLKEKKESFKRNGSCFNKKYWAFVDSLTPSFLCPIEIIEQFVGEKYDFTKHIKPLIDAKLIWIREWKNCFPHSESLAKTSLQNHGIVGESNKTYLQFYLGPEDPNKGRKFEDAWI